MERRTFLQVSAALSAASQVDAALAMPTQTLGKTGMQVSRFCLGGAHMRMKGEENATQMIHRSIDLGVTFFDSAAKYHNGASDETYGKALAGGLRKKVLLMSKAEKRDAQGATEQLENTLRRMNTDYLDLWQCHEVVRHDEVDKIFGPGGSLEAFVKAKKDGKVRHIGFTGHGDPSVHLRLLEGFDGWETVQCPINLVDPHYLSFTYNVLPRVKQKGLGMIAMKSNAMGGIGKNGIAPIEECLRFTLSQEPDTIVSGPQTLEELEQNIGIVKAWQKFAPQEISSILDRTRKGLIGTKVESYKKKEPWLAAAGYRPHEDGIAD